MRVLAAATRRVGDIPVRYQKLRSILTINCSVGINGTILGGSRKIKHVTLQRKVQLTAKSGVSDVYLFGRLDVFWSDEDHNVAYFNVGAAGIGSARMVDS